MVDLYVCGQVLCILPLMATATFVSQLCLSACVCFIFPFDILLWVSAISDKRLSRIHVLVRLFISQQTQILCLLTTAAVYETIAWNSNSAGQTFIKWELMCFYHIVVGHSFHFIQTGCALLTKLCSFQIHCSTLSPNGSISILFDISICICLKSFCFSQTCVCFITKWRCPYVYNSLQSCAFCLTYESVFV